VSAASRPVALILVSHSRALAEGAVELAGQMAPGVLLLAAGGMDDGSLGTSYDMVEAAVERATADGGRAVVIADLGSAVLTAESVLDLTDEDVAARVRIADAPFVEGAVAAAVTAHGGADLEAVLAAAQDAGSSFGTGPAGGEPAPHGDEDADGTRVTLLNPLGLHARPAALLSRLVAGFDARVTVDGVDAASVLALMKLGATKGQVLHVRAEGPQEAAALAAVVAAFAEGFGEV